MTLMAIPMIGVLLFTILPLIYMICLAFTSYDHNHLPPKSLFDWVGFTNFGNIFNGRMAANPLPFLSDPLWAKFSIIIVNMWVGIPVTMLVATGIIMNLPQEQIEAAEIDGASKFQIFKSITFPQILLVMMPNLIQQFIGNINNFNVIYLLTGGGPTNSNFYQAGSTDLLVTWLYNLTVTAADYNLASVIGIIIFVLSAVFSLLAYTRTSSYKEGVAK